MRTTFGARVIIADDNADMRDYIRRLLAQHYRVETVADGEAALAAARREKPDLIVAELLEDEKISASLGHLEDHMNFRSREPAQGEPQTSGARNESAAYCLQSQWAEA